MKTESELGRRRPAAPVALQESRDALLTAIAKSRSWIEDISLGRVASFLEIAAHESQGERHIRLRVSSFRRSLCGEVEAAALTLLGLVGGLRI